MNGITLKRWEDSRQHFVRWSTSDVRMNLGSENKVKQLFERHRPHNIRIYMGLTHCAILAVVTAAWRHPQTPACFTVFCMESPPKDTPSHFCRTPELWREQSTAWIQQLCAALWCQPAIQSNTAEKRDY